MLSALTLSTQRERELCNMVVLQHRHHVSHEGPLEQNHAHVSYAHLAHGIQL